MDIIFAGLSTYDNGAAINKLEVQTVRWIGVHVSNGLYLSVDRIRSQNPNGSRAAGDDQGRVEINEKSADARTNRITQGGRANHGYIVRSNLSATRTRVSEEWIVSVQRQPPNDRATSQDSACYSNHFRLGGIR
jgi:hypothetical protein